jgi:hypothetical protein
MRRSVAKRQLDLSRIDILLYGINPIFFTRSGHAKAESRRGRLNELVAHRFFEDQDLSHIGFFCLGAERNLVWAANAFTCRVVIWHSA